MRIVPTAELAALLGNAPLDIDPVSDLAFTVSERNVILDPVAVAAYHAANPLPIDRSPLYLLAGVLGLLSFGAIVFAALATITPPTANHAAYRKHTDRLPVHTSANFAYVAPLK